MLSVATHYEPISFGILHVADTLPVGIFGSHSPSTFTIDPKLRPLKKLVSRHSLDPPLMGAVNQGLP